MAHYEAAFQTIESRKPLLAYAQALPLSNHDTHPTVDLITHYSAFLQASPIPKCMLYAVPGFNTTVDTIQWCKAHLPNLTLQPLKHAFHYAPESMPDEFASTMIQWHQKQWSTQTTN